MVPVEFCSAWFCPYAQRAWIALNHHRIPYTLIESLEVVHGGYEKKPILLEKNPKGLVPTIIDDKKRVIYESLLCMEYVDEVGLNNNGNTKSLLPGDAMERARLRLQSDWVNKNLCSLFYKVLMPTDTQEESFKSLVENIKTFTQEMKGPYYNGDDLSIVDIAAFPWCMRLFLLEEYFGDRFKIEEDPTLTRFWEWKERVAALEAVKSTIASREKYVSVYERYRAGHAGSKVADAVMAGKQAHDID